MKPQHSTLALLVAGSLWAFNAVAQDHSQHQMPAPTPAPQAPPEHDHSQHQPAKSKSKPKPTSTPTPAPSEPTVDHATMDHGAHAQPATDVDHAAMGHDQPETQQEVDHAAMGHGQSEAQQEVDHAAMGHAAPHAPDQPRTPIPVLTDADRAAAVPPPQDHPVHDNAIHRFVLVDRLEGFEADEGRGVEWEAEAWFGNDHHKLWLRTEGERIAGDTEDADLEVLYGRSIARWWDVVAGVRHHLEPGDSEDFAVLGVMGMAPYKFEVNASLYVGSSGYTGARVEVEYETLLTNRLILQPAIEANLHGREDESHGNGAGLGTVEAGLRLRYEFTRQFAPYIGVVRERAYGRTADFRRADGEDIDDTRFVAGVRIWF